MLPPIPWDAPLLNPSPAGLYGITTWQTEGEGAPLRWGPGGIEVRTPHNFGGESATGVWSAEWCATEDDLGPSDIKTGTRPNNDDPPVFPSITAYGFDWCNPSAPSRVEVVERSRQNLRLQEQLLVEKQFAQRLMADTTDVAATDIVDAVSQLEEMLAATNTLGFIHARPGFAAIADAAKLIVRSSGGRLLTTMGHVWVFGGGYPTILGDTLVATSPIYGWRGPVVDRESLDFQHNRYVAIAERSVVLAYEKAIGAVTVS